VQIPVKELMTTKNQMIDRTDKLVGFEDADQMSGTLQSVFRISPYRLSTDSRFLSLASLFRHSWSIGFFDKVPLKKELEREPDTPPPPPPKTTTGESDQATLI